MLKYDIKIVSYEWSRAGYLRPGERGVFAQPIPMHIAVTHERLTLVYLLDDYVDRRTVVALKRSTSNKSQPRFVCPKCNRGVDSLILADDGHFACDRCAFGRKSQVRPIRSLKSEPVAWEKTQTEIETIRRRLGDDTSPVDEIPWPKDRMSSKTWLALLDELDALEARKLTEYAVHVTQIFDKIEQGVPLARRRKPRSKRG